MPPSPTPNDPTQPAPHARGQDPTVLAGSRPRRRCGPYELLAELGRGGMGTVYRARHVELGKDVALKVIRVGPATPDELVQRFRREARLAAGLRHPGLVAVHDFGAEGEDHWFVMDLVEGQSLDDWFAGHPPLAAVLEVLEKTARAVHHAHEQGVLHRDLKPANLRLDARGQPVVLDFGLAKGRDLVGDGALTDSGAVFGTPRYMAPEQAAGRHEQIDARTDVYALGAILYEAATGRVPYPDMRTAEVLVRLLVGPPDPPRSVRRDLSPTVERAILKAMAREPADRFADALAFAEALRAARERLAASPAAVPIRARGTLYAGLAAAALLVGLGSWAMRDRTPGTPAGNHPALPTDATGEGTKQPDMGTPGTGVDAAPPRNDAPEPTRDPVQLPAQADAAAREAEELARFERLLGPMEGALGQNRPDLAATPMREALARESWPTRTRRLTDLVALIDEATRLHERALRALEPPPQGTIPLIFKDSVGSAEEFRAEVLGVAHAPDGTPTLRLRVPGGAESQRPFSQLHWKGVLALASLGPEPIAEAERTRYAFLFWDYAAGLRLIEQKWVSDDLAVWVRGRIEWHCHQLVELLAADLGRAPAGQWGWILDELERLGELGLVDDERRVVEEARRKRGGK